MKKHHKLRSHLSSSDSSPKKFFVKALNTIGFYSTKWSRLLSCEKVIKPRSCVMTEKTGQAIKNFFFECSSNCLQRIAKRFVRPGGNWWKHQDIFKKKRAGSIHIRKIWRHSNNENYIKAQYVVSLSFIALFQC